MRAADNWQDYALLDASSGEKLERWGRVTLIRPDPQIIWKTGRTAPGWNRADAHYFRSKTGGGHWEYARKFPESWTVSYGGLTFKISPTGFKHTGHFPEQAVNWDLFQQLIREAGRPVSVLNLFAYTGGATLACLQAGASVCHVDASKGMVQWARENAQLSGLEDKPVRWIVDDCEKFIRRELRRGRRYDAIVMDPPSYGRGPGGEVWQLEEKVYELVELCCGVLSDHPLFVALSSYNTGLPASGMAYLLGVTVGKKYRGQVQSDEIGLPVRESGLVMPCGAVAVWTGA